MTIPEIISKRRRLWAKNPNIAADDEFVKSVAVHLLSDKAHIDELKIKPYLLIELCFQIVSKDKQTIPFFLNEVQRDFIAQLEQHGTAKPYFILKGRQQGFTSLITAIQLSYAIVKRNFAGCTIADTSDNVMAIFNDKAKFVYNKLPDVLKPTEKYNSKNELFFEKLFSSWRIMSATKEVGRSKTINFLHLSEVAFFDVLLSDLQGSIGEALTKNCITIYETTANGFNEAQRLWADGKCHNLFYEWWRTGEYEDGEVSVLEELPDTWIRNRVVLLKAKGLSDRQITWYVKKYNNYLDKDKIKQEYPCSPDEAFISSGNCVFDKDIITNRLATLDNIYKKGYYEYSYINQAIKDPKFVERSDGYIKIFKPPEPGKTYCIGGDTAGEGSDYFIGQVLDAHSGEQVAVLRHKFDEDMYARQMYCLGKYYNTALIAIESNFSTYPIKELQRLDYPKQYRREVEDTYKDKTKKSYGFKTTSLTRPIIIADLVAIVRENAGLINDNDTLREMLSFIKNKVGRAEAESGANDDCIIALAIAYYVRESALNKNNKWGW